MITTLPHHLCATHLCATFHPLPLYLPAYLSPTHVTLFLSLSTYLSPPYTYGTFLTFLSICTLHLWHTLLVPFSLFYLFYLPAPFITVSSPPSTTTYLPTYLSLTPVAPSHLTRLSLSTCIFIYSTFLLLSCLLFNLFTNNLRIFIFLPFSFFLSSFFFF